MSVETAVGRVGDESGFDMEIKEVHFIDGNNASTSQRQLTPEAGNHRAGKDDEE